VQEEEKRGSEQRREGKGDRAHAPRVRSRGGKGTVLSFIGYRPCVRTPTLREKRTCLTPVRNVSWAPHHRIRNPNTGVQRVM
jgi:hypothetical protein